MHLSQDAVHKPIRQDTPYFPAFDWLRGICALAVLWYHGGILGWEQSGNFPVQVFFALSGWLIGGILLETETPQLPRFYFNRAIRIWIPYYLAAAILLTLSVMREPITPKWIEIVNYKLTFVYNLFGTPQLAQYHDAMPQKGTLSHFWSVNVEEQFYLMAPLLLVIGKRFGRHPLLWLGLAVLGSFNDFCAISLGVLAAILVRRHGDIHRLPAVRALLAVVLAGCIAAFRADFHYRQLAPVAGLCIVLLLAVPGRRSSLGALVGGMSYPLYLNHWIGIFAAHAIVAKLHLPQSAAVNAALQALIAVPLAMGLYWFVDRQLLAHRGGWYTPAKGLALTTAAYLIIAVGLAYGFWMRG